LPFLIRDNDGVTDARKRYLENLILAVHRAILTDIHFEFSHCRLSCP